MKGNRDAPNDARKEICKRIYSEFGIEVLLRTKEAKAETLKDLFSALKIISSYYGFESDSLRDNGIRIAIEDDVYDRGLFFRKEHPINGEYVHRTHTIRLPVSHPGSLVHELIHAVDHGFRNPGMKRRTLYSDIDSIGFLDFMKQCGVPEKDILDFQDVFGSLSKPYDDYLSLPSEIVARIGAYSFWKDNKSVCKDNPFLSFFPSNYVFDMADPDRRRDVVQFPFHSVIAMRYFIHHAAREASGKPFERWELNAADAPEHDGKWYKAKRAMLEDPEYSRNIAVDMIEGYCDDIEKKDPAERDYTKEDAQKGIGIEIENLVTANRRKEQAFNAVMNRFEDAELQERMRRTHAPERYELLRRYVSDCEKFATIEKRLKEATKEQAKTSQREKGWRQER